MPRRGPQDAPFRCVARVLHVAAIDSDGGVGPARSIGEWPARWRLRPRRTSAVQGVTIVAVEARDPLAGLGRIVEGLDP